MSIIKKMFGVILFILVIFFVIRSDSFWSLIKPIIHKEILNRYAGEYKIDPLFVAAIMEAESKFSLRAKSHAGALGLMQILPATAQELAAELNLPNYHQQDLYIPEVNIHLGYYYLAKLRREFNNDSILVLAAYNAGNAKVHQWLEGKNKLLIEEIPFKETRMFVGRVLKNYRQLRYLQTFRRWLHFKFDQDNSQSIARNR